MGQHTHHRKPEYKSPAYTQETRIYKQDAESGEITFVTVDVRPTSGCTWEVRAKYHSAEEKPGSLRNVIRFHTLADAKTYGQRIANGRMKREKVEALCSVFNDEIACDIWDRTRRDTEREAWERGSRPTALQRAAAALAAHPDVKG